MLIRKNSDSINDIKLLAFLLLFQYYEYVVRECLCVCVCVCLKESKSVCETGGSGVAIAITCH